MTSPERIIYFLLFTILCGQCALLQVSSWIAYEIQRLCVWPQF